jgi:probable F420-dependent oxidoreductase
MGLFRFGVSVRQARSRVELAETARKIEDLGYNTLTVPDHLTDLMAPMPALVGAAEATRNLRVGTNVLNNDLRHPVLVAREAATVDLLTEGRLQLGLGAGSIQSEYDQAGLGFDAGSTRVERLAEAVAVIKGLLKGERVTFAGRHYCVTGHTIEPLPVQRPHPPILIGGTAGSFSRSPRGRPTSSASRGLPSGAAARFRPISPGGGWRVSTSGCGSCAGLRARTGLRGWS